ncbi:hypothetical protein FHR32_007653 [Streptosporangium album]|uniref:Epoxide hydrolase N-terminal domain-containing protein n=1 Tax=Streptosporangium album TaxID=47479 RepID=A0A7W7S4S7_9ACTN|nr:epoxide hydrolase N-terminal domain-containing protein [Streptosporangium album]MBB4943253.1 hypothetical protein [Streptosporangium album]
MPTETDLTPYRIEIPPPALADLSDRLRRARFDDVGRSHVQGLVDYWRDGYDWRAR